MPVPRLRENKPPAWACPHSRATAHGQRLRAPGTPGMWVEARPVGVTGTPAIQACLQNKAELSRRKDLLRRRNKLKGERRGHPAGVAQG